MRNIIPVDWRRKARGLLGLPRVLHNVTSYLGDIELLYE